MRTYILTILVLLFLAPGSSLAQQLPMYNAYPFNPFLYNPAVAGKGESINLFLIHKNQLTGMPANPETNVLTVEGPLSEKHGAGIQLYQDRAGIFSRTSGFGNYAYHLTLADEHRLSLGLGFGVVNNNVNRNEVIAKDQNDPILVGDFFQRTTADANAGLHYRWDRLNVGFVVSHLIENSIDYQQGEQGLGYRLSRHFLASISYDYPISKELSIMPVIVVPRMKNGPLPAEGMAILNWRDMASVGVGYKDNYGLTFLVRIKLFQKLSIGYSYDWMTTDLQTFAGATHEVMLGYAFEPVTDAIEKQEQQIKQLINQYDSLEAKQARHDSIQQGITSRQDQQQQQLDTLSDGYQQQQSAIDSLGQDIESTKEELSALEQKLKDAGVLKEGKRADYETPEGETAEAGYYLIIASVHEKNYNPLAMQREFLDKGYEVVFNKQRGWYYVYTLQTDRFSQALQELREARQGEHEDAWIHILR